MTDNEQLLIAQVLTLAKTLELLDCVRERKVVTTYEREAARLINRKGPDVLRWLAETKEP